jgi:hypothetical protein
MTTCLDLNYIQVLNSARTKAKIIWAANSESLHVLNKSDISILQHNKNSSNKRRVMYCLIHLLSSITRTNVGLQIVGTYSFDRRIRKPHKPW